jgi:hypothetical protein
MQMLESLSEGLALGLATGTACLASCGPVYATYLMSEERSGWQSLRVILLLNLGRFVAYAGFGAILGLLGGYIPASVRLPLAYGGYLLFSVYLIVSVVRVHKACSGCGVSRFMKVTRSPLLLGVLTGFSICPAFLIAMTSAFETSGAPAGAMLFTGFFAGTTVYMLPFALFGLLTRVRWITTAARFLAVAVAVYFGVVGVRGLASVLSGGGAATAVQGNGPHSGGDATEVFTITEADTVYVIHFPADTSDHGAEMADFLQMRSGWPPVRPISSDSAGWRADLDRLPSLSAVLAPYWVGSAGEGAGWRDSLRTALDTMGARVLAVEYTPWCSATPSLLVSFLERYSFRTGPDGGFVFAVRNPEDASECATCPLAD